MVSNLAKAALCVQLEGKSTPLGHMPYALLSSQWHI